MIFELDLLKGFKKKKTKYVGRERVLELEELAKLWIAAEQFEGPQSALMKLLLLTGQRRGEIANLQAGWLEEDNAFGRFISIPAQKHKTSGQHLVPITLEVAALIDQLTNLEAGPFLLTSTAGERPFSKFSKAKTCFDKATGIESWTFHDIRRSIATHMVRLGIPQEHIEHLLGHAISSASDTSDRFAYMREKRVALERWSEALRSAVEKQL